MINKNRRREERVNVVLPVRLDAANGITRDISAGGACFEVDAIYGVGSEINFVIEMKALGANMLVKCTGNIVRTQVLDQKISVAVKLTDAVMEAAN